MPTIIHEEPEEISIIEAKFHNLSHYCLGLLNSTNEFKLITIKPESDTEPDYELKLITQNAQNRISDQLNFVSFEFGP